MVKIEPEDAVQGGARAVPTRQVLERRKFPVGDDTCQNIGQQACEVAQCRVSILPDRWIESQGAVPDGARHRMARKAADHAQGIVPEGGAHVRKRQQIVDRAARLGSVVRADVAPFFHECGRRKPGGANRCREILRSMFGCAVAWGHLARNRRKSLSRHRPLSAAAARAVARARSCAASKPETRSGSPNRR